MKAWSHDPRKFLLMHLKLVKGVHFSNPLGEILVSIPNSLESTIVTKWQYRMMLGLDGEKQFVEVVRDVKTEFSGEFAASDVWMFLDWMIENELLEEDDTAEQTSFDPAPVLPELTASPSTTRTFLKVPLQVLAVLLLCGATVLGTYTATPILIAALSKNTILDEIQSAPAGEAAETEVAAAGAEPTPVAPDEEIPEVVEKKLVRVPKVAESKEVTFAARAQIVEEPSLVDKLTGMRREMAACQIRRDEYYLLNDEKGYRAEVARISELVKEIGQIQADISE